MRAKLYVVMLYAFLAGCSDGIVQKGEAAVTGLLKDPSSAQFSEVTRCGNGSVIRGKINAKNGFGGYSGAENFVSDGRDAAIMGSENTEIFVRLMRQCTNDIMASIPRRN